MILAALLVLYFIALPMTFWIDPAKLHPKHARARARTETEGNES